LGGALLQAKRYDEAAAAFREALKLLPDEADLHGNLGLALQKAGHATEAQKEFALAEKLRNDKKK
jgi:Flp pilus assembly protein TadD